MEIHREIRFYICLLLGFCLLMCGFYTDPPGEISKSVLIAFGAILTIAAVSVGVDVKGILLAVAEMKRAGIAELNKENKQNNE